MSFPPPGMSPDLVPAPGGCAATLWDLASTLQNFWGLLNVLQCVDFLRMSLNQFSV